MPTERKRAIRSSAGWTANQAAMEAEYGVGNYYTTLSAWEAAEQANLTTLDEIRTAVCYNDWPSGLDDQPLIDGWTTDATRYVVVRPASGHGHAGVPGSGFRIVKALTGDFSAVFRNNAGYTVVRNIGVEQSATGGSFRHALRMNGSYAKADSCLVSSKSGFGLLVEGFTAMVSNCLAYAGVGSGIRATNNLGKIYNCVAAGNTTGFDSEGSSVTVTNSVAYNNTTGFNGTWSAASSNNASSAASGAPGSGAVYSVSSAAFTNTASNNFHLTSGSVLRGAGVNLYSAFTTDIDGNTWPSSGAWDIGYDYYVAAGGVTLNSLSVSNITSSGARFTVGLTR